MSEARDRIRVYELSRRVGEIMHYLWDPIGVAKVAQARDEYDNYVPAVTGMLMRGAKKDELAAYLTRTSTETMGLTDTSLGRAHDEEIAGLLIEHFAVVEAQFRENG